LILLFLLFSTAAIGRQAAQKPKEPTPQTEKFAPATVSSAQADSKASAPCDYACENVVAVAHTVVANAEALIAIVGVLVAILGLGGATNLVVSVRYGKQMWRLQEQYRKLKDDKSTIQKELEELGQEKNKISEEMADFKEQEKSLRKLIETVSKEVEELREQEKSLRKLEETVLNDVAELREQEESLRKLEETVLKDVVELREQEKSLRKLAEAVQSVVTVRSPLGDETRLKALQQLSQQVVPQGIAPLLEVLKGRDNVKLRLEAAYGLGRYSEDTAFREYYPEIFSGFREVLANPKTPDELAAATRASASRFNPVPDELAPYL
jgi:archaellum component FlaC